MTEAGKTYKANWWTQGNDPASSNGATGTGQPWTITTSCTTTPAPPPPPTTPPPPPTPAPPPSSCAPWVSTTAYNGGATVSEGGKTYQANWWTQGDDPATHNGATGTGQPWTITTNCSTAPTPPTPPSPPPGNPPPPPPPGSPPPSGFVFGSYKDITVNMDWNIDQISTSVTGTRSPVLNVMPAKPELITWAFATGECGSENWAGLTPAAVAAAERADRSSAPGKKYVISTGGADGSFTCGTDADFETFVNRYASSSLAGIDFDIEGRPVPGRRSTTWSRASRPRSPSTRACAGASRWPPLAATRRRAWARRASW